MISAHGLLFMAKHRPVLQRVCIRAWTQEIRLAFRDFPRAGETGELLGDGEVRIVGRDGSVLASRERPRAAFRHWRRQLYWDDLDFVYFAGYALWNYLTTPFLFLRGGFRFEPLPPLVTRGETWSRMRVIFPEGVPTHSRIQDLYFDGQHRLRRLDYTAEVVGRWARAAHLCEGYRDFGGLLVPTRRIVTPLPFGDRPMPFPTLVAIDIHGLQPQSAA